MIPFFVLFRYVFDIVKSAAGYLKYILITLLVFYALQLVTSTIWYTMKCDIPENCNILKWILLISNILIMISSGVYFFYDNFNNKTINKDETCEKLFGLTVGEMNIKPPNLNLLRKTI